MIFHELQIKSLSRLTPDSVEINLEVPEKLKSEYKFRPGQYITVEMNGNRRDYSLSSSPLDDRLTIGIKSVKKGVVSKILNTDLKEGDFLKVSTPTGRFGIESKPEVGRTVVAFAAGSGITPVLSILKYTLQTEKDVDFYLFYGNRTPQDVMFMSVLEDLRNQYPENFHPHLFYTRHKLENTLFEGRINIEKLNFILSEVVAIHTIDEVVVCGPNGMVKEITDEFLKAGLSKDKVHFELFEKPEDFDIPADTMEVAPDEPVAIEVELDGEVHQLKWEDPNKSLLDTMLDAGIDAPYSCKGGICSSCMCVLEKGEVNLGENFVLSEDDVEDGIIVACCSHPKSKKIRINYDDL